MATASDSLPEGRRVWAKPHLLTTLLRLMKVGALAVSGQREDENPHDGELTFLGRVLAQLPVSQQLGKLIVLGHVFGCLDECLIIGERAAARR